MLLLASAAMVPATCVPCQFEYEAPHQSLPVDQSPGSDASGSRPLPSRAVQESEIMS
jgi:hypothetical protein